jgi:uncharacterized OsmC-like protein
MGERVRVIQDSDYRMQFLATDPERAEAELEQVSHLHQLTPYGMLLASLASCTTIVLHTYARAHGIRLHQAAVRVEYERSFREDCQDCHGEERYEELITEQVELSGELSGRDREKLHQVARFCSIRRMLESGIRIGRTGEE